MTWATKKINLPDDCPNKYEFPGHPDNCTHKGNRKLYGSTLCIRANCPYVKEGTAYRNPIEDLR